MTTPRGQWLRRVAAGAAGVVLATTLGAGSAAAAPGDPPLTLAHFVAAGKPVFADPDGQRGATYHSQKAGESILVQCTILSGGLGGGWFTGGTTTTYRAQGPFGGGYVDTTAVQLPPHVGQLPSCGWMR